MFLSKGKVSTKLLIILILMAVSVLGYFLYRNNKEGSSQAGILSIQQAGDKAMNFINENLLTPEVQATLIETSEENGVYMLKLSVQDTEHISYITKDGKMLFIDGINLEEFEASNQASNEEVVQADRPDVKLFVMSYCPYGLQAQKMFLPVYQLLSAQADMGVYFVSYIMHGKEEIDENLVQYCIEKEQKDKYYDYLTCFVKDDNSQQCLSDAGIDQSQMASCISQTDSQYNISSQYADQSTWLSGSYPKFDVNADLNQQYGVQGSPTIVINGTAVEVGPRSPEKFKQVICQAFTNPPEECSQTLSDTAFSAGFGYDSAAANADGGCGQ